MLSAPDWVNRFYSKFPLVVLEPEGSLDWKNATPVGRGKEYTLWVHAAEPGAPPPNEKYYWASPEPTSLHAQLLLLLRGVPVNMRAWTNEAAVPGGTLPTLHLTSGNRLVPHSDIRAWLDSTHKLSKNAELHGMPNQAAYDEAVAIAKLVLGRIKPALLLSATRSSSEDVVLLAAEPPPLSAGLSTPLPASLTGDARTFQESEVIDRGVEALSVLASKLDSEQWALGAAEPSPLDALITAHVHSIYSLPHGSPLKNALQSLPQLERYAGRVMEAAADYAH